jgi:DNA-binding XRE family transcriptional regulator
MTTPPVPKSALPGSVALVSPPTESPTKRAVTLPDLSGLGLRLRTLRELAGLTYRELADLVGVCYSTLVHIEHGRSQTPRVDVVVGVARALGVTIEWLTLGEGKAPRARKVKAAVLAAGYIPSAKAV